MLASATDYVWRSVFRGAITEETRQLQTLLTKNLGDENIWPDLTYDDLDKPLCFANTVVLQELIDRSVKKQDLYDGLTEMLRAALKLHPKFVRDNKAESCKKRQ